MAETELLITHTHIMDAHNCDGDEEQKSESSSTTSVPEASTSGSCQKCEIQAISDFEVKVEIHKVGDFTITKKEKINNAAGCSKTKNNMITFHDIGLNHDSFDEFMNNSYNLQFYDKFVMYHVDAAGQEKDAVQFSDDFDFPTLPVLAVKLRHVLEHFKLTDLIGLGVGAGANILMQLAMEASERFLGIAITDPSAKAPSFKEWGEEKLASWQLNTKGFTTVAQRFLIWHLFGTSKNMSKPVNLEMVDRYIRKMRTDINPHNLSAFVKSYMGRKDILAELRDRLKCRILIITSEYSPYKEQGELIHTTLSQHRQKLKQDIKSEIIIGQNAINIFFEDPGKCGEAVLALMQGCGIVPTLRSRSASKGGPMHRTASMSEDDA